MLKRSVPRRPITLVCALGVLGGLPFGCGGQNSGGSEEVTAPDSVAAGPTSDQPMDSSEDSSSDVWSLEAIAGYDAGCAGDLEAEHSPSTESSEMSRALQSSVLEEAWADESTHDESTIASIDSLTAPLVTAAGAPPCGLVPGNAWLARTTAGKNSDPLNMIICFSGVTWKEVYGGLAALEGRAFWRHWPWPPVKGKWKKVTSPVQYSPGNPPFKDGTHCTNALQAEYGTTTWREQEFAAREGGCDSVLWNGVNHFRLWGSGSSAAMSVSTEKPCQASYVNPKHCIVSFDRGRDLLSSQLETVAANLKLTIVTGLYDTQAGGTIRQPDGTSVSYDGKVRVIALVR